MSRYTREFAARAAEREAARKTSKAIIIGAAIVASMMMGSLIISVTKVAAAWAAVLF